MAGNLYVTEYSALGLGETGAIPQEPPLADYKIAVGAASTNPPQTFNAATRFVRLAVDALNAVSVLIQGPGATVTTSNQRLAPNQTEYKAVPQGAGFGVYSIQNT